MKGFLFVLILTFCHHPMLGQETSCVNQLDSAEVTQIAKKRKAYWTKGYFLPKVTYQQDSCEWTVISTKTRHTNRGNCKRTNGCTLIKTVTLVIEGQTGKVKSKKKKKRLMPNYE